MENNFYVGIVCHSRRGFKPFYKEKVVLYSENYIEFIELFSEKIYTLDESRKDYVERETLIPTNVSEYRENYPYLLSKYKSRTNIRKKSLQ